MLRLQQLAAGYGNIKALKNIDLTVPAGSIVSLIGANGAGKTTVMKVIMGLIKPESGQILFKGQNISGAATHKIVSLGLSLVPEGRSILSRMTVLENLEMGACQRNDNEVQADLQRIFQRFPILEERKSQLGGTLSGGQQQMLAIGRALMSRPELLLLDEPSMGLAPLVVADIFKVIQEINQEGTTVLLVEQNVRQALKIAKYAYVLETGRISLHGQAVDIAKDSRVMEAYLGGKK
ncbi:branched-chain amino acid transport system ATP-binding protein [Pelosinus fermentans]|uniref:ABC transporter related protein n=1 Tax=Pelosinus fermentans B4 TaxID=1149862 RepID=I9LHY0_9FIRM|nr:MULTISPECIES: ABC transporter ATP-binding protein [Pelosinus]EIW20129.1 ABC transporter related protein [Pelosinus fermentans B4]OAM93065.1 Monosaccharide-transporting ATPase [Pelosinus fermentans DSM 17108]SDQ65844.1 branched-chain amino acid transport system ATP-binding protein [Pelosinus fermentans]